MTQPAFIRFFALVFRRFAEDRCIRIASSLSYTTLLSLVPLVAVALTVLTAFPAFDRVATHVGDFIVNNFIPASGAVIQDKVMGFEKAVRGLSAIGTGVLFLTALMTMKTIDQALNDIWRIKSQRKGVSAFMVYWTILTLGPLFVGGSLILTSYLTSLTIFGVDTGLGVKIVRLIPFMSTMVGFALLYIAVPNQKVPVRSAIIGGVVAAILFELAKKAFAGYVTHFPSYNVVYGAMATIPLFLMWVYISWLIILLGAEITYCLASWKALKNSGSSSIRYTIDGAMQVLSELAQAQRTGQGLTHKQLVQLTGLPYLSISEYLRCFEQEKIVRQDRRGPWFLSKESDMIRVYDVCLALPIRLSELLKQENTQMEYGSATAYAELKQQLEQGLAMTLKETMKKQEKRVQ